MSEDTQFWLRPETLLPRTQLVFRSALASGALKPIATDCHLVEDGGMPFQVRLLGLAHRKERPPEELPQGPPVNPFENPDPALVVADVTPTHLCVLNKFNVVAHHLLLVMRAFEEQESPLTAADFEALARCLAGLDGLAFYNAGETAGASQRHKHLQLVPPLGPDGLKAPLERLLSPPPSPGTLATLPALGFAHAITGLALEGATPAGAAAQLEEAYATLRAALGFAPDSRAPYNLLATRSWMLFVPRSQAAGQGIEVNALGFAGSLLARTPEQLADVRARGPLALLRQVALPSPT